MRKDKAHRIQFRPKFTVKFYRTAWLALGVSGVLLGRCLTAEPANTPLGTNAAGGTAVRGLTFINTSFENASPVWYEFKPDGVVLVHLLYDHERASPNRAAGHIHFLLEGTPGTRLTLELTNLDNVWNGQPGSVARE